MCKFLISVLFAFFISCLNVEANTNTFVSLSPALTEVMYALGAQDMLLGVSNACDTPEDAKSKEKIGDSFFVNYEKILKLKPNYILALDSSGFALAQLKKFGITPLCFKYPDIDSIHQNILEIGKLTGKIKEAQNLVNVSNSKIKKTKAYKAKKILYLVQPEPMITVGNKSFISDMITKSGNVSITADINSYYPVINEEFAVLQKPDVVVLGFMTESFRIKKLFPNAKIVVINRLQSNYINRPGPNIYKAVEFFSSL